jgi:chromosome segregation ATPase
MKLAVAIMAAFMIIPSGALAQVRVIARDRESVTVRVESGARMRHLARAIGREPDMESIARSNPGHIIYVCYDNMPGERPFMSRDADSWNACQHFPRERWFVAGVVYRVPLVTESAAAEEAASTAASLWREEGLRSEIRGLEDRVVELQDELESTRVALNEADARADEVAEPMPVLRERNARLERDMAGMSWLLATFFLLFLLMGFGVLYVLWRTRQMLRRIMITVRRERVAWSTYTDKMRRNREEIIGKLTAKIGALNGQIVMLTRSIDESSKELARIQAQQGRLRKRIKTCLARLRENRNLLIAAANLIQDFHAKQAENLALRDALPNLLKLVDEAHRHRIHADNARSRVELIRRWMKEFEAIEHSDSLREITLNACQGMIAEYERELETHEAAYVAAEGYRSKLVSVLYALTGIMTDSVDPDGRLKRSIDAAERNNALLVAQQESMHDLFRLQNTILAELRSREEAIKHREGEIEEGERELLGKIRQHETDVEAWKREHEVKAALSAFEQGLAAESQRAEVARVTDIEARMAELEGRTNGLERRAIAAEAELDDANKFIEEARKEFRASKELIEGIKKGPQFVEARLAQCVEYIRQLEEKLGITRKSIWEGLPEVPYGSVPPKAKA